MGSVNQTLLLASVLKRRFLPAIATFGATLIASAAYLWTVESEYIASARLIVDERSVSISELGQELTASRTDPPGDANPLATESELVKSQRVIEKALTLLAEDGKAIDQLEPRAISKGLSVKIIPATNILEVSYRTNQPAQAADILNAILRAMVADSAEAIRSEASSVRTFLEAEVPKLQSRLAEAESAESEYRQQNRLVAPEQQAVKLIESLSALEETENQLSAQLQGAVTRDRQLQQLTDVSSLSQAYAAVRVGQNSELQDLRQQLLVLETQVIDSQSRLGDQHPDLLALLEQRDQTRALYSQQVALQAANTAGIAPENIAADDLSQDLLSQLILGDVERSALESRLQVIQAERTRLESLLTELPAQQKPLATLIRQKEEVEASLALLQNKLEEARIAEAQLISNVRIIDKANVPLSADWPQPRAIIVLAIAAGTVLAAGVVVLLELLDDAIHSATDLNSLTQRPCLGTLPKLPGATLQLYHPEPFLDNPALVEPYRMLLQTLAFRAQNQCRIIVITSALADEGKSIVASHLAAVAALLSRRTLLVDIDLRRPSQATLLNQPSTPGLTTVLAEKHSLSEAIQTTPLENLWLLPHGELSNRPSVVLEQIVRQNLLKEAAQHFDYVVIDTPPVTSCADAMTVAQQSDGTILIARSGFTPRPALRQAIADLENSGISLLGVVMNGGNIPTTLQYQSAPVGKTKVSV